jgi:hypothetical protein
VSTLEPYQGTEAEALCVTSGGPGFAATRNYIASLARVRRVLVVADEPFRSQERLVASFVDDVLEAGDSNRALLVSAVPSGSGEFDAEFRVDDNFQLRWSIRSSSILAWNGIRLYSQRWTATTSALGSGELLIHCVKEDHPAHAAPPSNTAQIERDDRPQSSPHPRLTQSLVTPPKLQ